MNDSRKAANTVNSYQNNDMLIFPPRMIKQTVQPKNEMNASAPINMQSMRQAHQDQQEIISGTLVNTIDSDKQKRALSNKNKKKLPSKLNKQLLGSIIGNEALNKSQLIDKPKPTAAL